MATANPTQFWFYRNTKFTDMQNTLHFNSSQERNEWFDNITENTKDSAIPVTVIHKETPFNFRRDRGVLKVTGNMDDLRDVNYCRFKDSREQFYYAFVASMSYVSDNVTRMDIVIDVMMTFCQGNFMGNKSINMIRGTLNKEELNKYLETIRTSDDYIPSPSLRYVDGDKYVFTDFSVIIQSSVDLSKDFGKESAPKMSTSTGGTIDGNTSPCDLYIIGKNDFSKAMDKLQAYPWITQNFKDLILIPTDLIPDSVFNQNNKVSNSKVDGFPDTIYKIPDGTEGLMIDTKVFTRSYQQLLETLTAYQGDTDLKYLLRNGLMTIEVTDHRGGKMIIDPSEITTSGLSVMIESVIGYTNEIVLYNNSTGNRYDSSNKVDVLTHFLDSSLSIDNFDHMPVLIDNSTLQKANTAYNRQVQDSRQITGKVGTLFNKNSSLKDRLYSGFSIYSDVFAGNFGGGLVSGVIGSTAKAANLLKNEYEYEQDKAAQFKQWDITPPTVTSGTFGSSLPRKLNTFGFTMKIATAPYEIVDSNITYHAKYGFDLSSLNVSTRPTIRHSTTCDWIQCTFNSTINRRIETAFNIQIANLMEAGVRFFYDYTKIGGWNPLENKPL